MPKKILIPTKMCLSLSPNLLGCSSIKKVEYDKATYGVEKQQVVAIDLDPYIVNYSDDEQTSISSITENTKFNYEKKIKGLDIGEGRNTLYVDVRIDMSNIVLKYEDLENATVTLSINKSIVDGSSIKSESKDYNITWLSTTQGLTAGDMHYKFFREDGKIILRLLPLVYSWSYPSKKIYMQSTITISILQRAISNENISVGSSNSNASYGMTTNEFMDSGTTYNEQIVCDYIANEILKEYNSVKETVEATIVMSDYYDENGNVVIDKSKGEVVEIGDLIKFTSNKENELYTNKWFVVTTAEFNYNGCPKMIIKGKEVITSE